MKKRWFVTAILALTLCLCSTPALAAVESGGVRYLWYTRDGEQTWGENGQVTAFSGERFFLSADGGVTYASIPEFQAASRQGWTDYDVRVTPLDNGGLRVEARSTFGEAGVPYTQRWDYTAEQLSQLLAKAEPDPVRVLADNGSVQVGVRTIYDYENGDEALAPNVSAWRQQSWGEELVWSADGEHWSRCQYPEDFEYSYAMEGWWDGAFYLGKLGYTPDGYISPDGMNWAYLEELPISPELCLTADWGRYHFEVVKLRDDPNDCYNEVYLMEGKERDKGVLLPHMGDGIRAQGIGVNSLTARSGPNDTVILTASGYNGSFSLDYPVSSLDWCLENLSEPFRWMTQPAAEASNGEGLFLTKVAEHYRNGNTYEMEGELLRCDGTGWRKVEDTPFSPVFRLLPFNGKTFLVEDNATGRHRLYASEDGLSWTEVTALRPQDMEGDVRDYVQYAMTWTGSGYLACREAGNYGNRAGGSLYGGNTSVYLLDESFALTGAHDFGRIVQAVGFYEGNYYAQVSDSEGTQWQGVYYVSYDENGREIYSTAPGYYNQYAPVTLYRSTDGKTWEKLPDIYKDYEDVMASTKGGSGVGNQPTGDANKPLRMVAQLGQYRFALKEVWGGYTVGLMMNNAQDWMELDGMWEAIQSHWIIPGEVSARHTVDGGIEVTVTDLSTPGMKCAISYSETSLNESLKAGVRTEGNVRDRYHIEKPEEERSKPGIADVAVMALLNGESEIVYRSAATDGKYMYYGSVPWSNSVTLLPFSGKDFMVLDKVDGKIYLSSDGVNWREATGSWVTGKQSHNYWEYAFAWTGEHYLGICMLADDITGDGYKVVGHRQWSRENCEVVCLDENLNLLRAANLDAEAFTTAIGCRDGVCYVQLQNGLLLESPNGGRSWLESDVLKVRESMVELQ